jgi:hypothetical protein
MKNKNFESKMAGVYGGMIAVGIIAVSFVELINCIIKLIVG